jgi:hypothetical protein
MSPRDVATRDHAVRTLSPSINEPVRRQKRRRGSQKEVLILPSNLLGCLLVTVVMCLALPSPTSSLTPIISTTLHRHKEQRSTFSYNPDSRLLKKVSSPFQSQPKQSACMPPISNCTLIRGNSEDSLHILSRRFTELEFLLEDPNGDSASIFPSDGDDPTRTSTTPICRVVTRSDRKIPTAKGAIPASLSRPPYVLRNLDNLFHAISYSETRRLQYFETSSTEHPTTSSAGEDARLVDVTRTSLEDAGFQLLSRRDLDLCEALNAGYLLRLSILPDVSKLDPTVAQEFYPELFDSKGKPLNDQDEVLFNGRVLVFWRGYSSETTKGRLILPKLDYLQASVVQSSAAW